MLNESDLVLYDYNRGSAEMVGAFSSLRDLENSGVIEDRRFYVVYEKEPNEFFSATLRLLATRGVRVGLAQVAPD